jgi:microcystin degradation protein MlrC
VRIALGGLSHETNTYALACFGPTVLEDFAVSRGEEIVRRYRGTRTFIGGMLDGADAIGAIVVPTTFAITQPSGTIARAAFDALKDELLDGIRAAMPVDAVALDLHGAGVVEGIDDLEGTLVAEIRALVGDDVKIVAPLDLHGNITERMAEVIDLMLGVHYYPHTDMYERGLEAMEALPRLVSGELRPVTHVEHLPMLLPTSTTDHGPAKVVNELCWELEREPGVVDCTFFHGFPFTDTPEAGVHIVVTTDGDRALAERTAKRVAAHVWEHREDFRPETETPEIALRRAVAVAAERGGPVVVNDTADNCGGGAPGDGTHVLRALLEAKPDRAAFGFLYDPEVAAAAHRAGVGATIDVRLGGKHDALHGEPLALRAYVKALTDGRFTYTTPMFGGMATSYGPMARLVVTEGPSSVDILVGSERSQTFDTEVFLLHGIDVTRYDVVALKSSNHFRAGFAHLATEIITADSPGLTTQRTEVFERSRAAGPLWPKDPDAAYQP